MTTAASPISKLSLYHYDSCPYCQKTRTAINALGQDIELRNILLQPENLTELVQGGGKSQVPCLRIDKANGESEWLYESDQIIRYLKSQQKQYANQRLSA